MQIAITGSSGFIGTHLVRECTRRGWSVIGLDVAPPAGDDQDLQFRQWDCMTDPLPDLSGCDATFILSQSPHYRQFPEQAPHLWGVNVLGTAKVVEAAAAADVGWLFLASTGSVYVPSLEPLDEEAPTRRSDPYAASKLAAEDLVALYPGNATSGRFFTVYGPGQENRAIPSIIERVRTEQPVSLSPVEDEEETPGLRISIALADDVASRLADMAEMAKEGTSMPDVLNIAPPTAASIRSIAEAAGTALGVDPVFEIADSMREGDFIAQTSRLEAFLPGQWTSELDGVARTINEAASSIS